MGSIGLDGLALLDVVSSVENTHESLLRDQEQQLLARRSKENMGRLNEKEMGLIIGTPVPILDNEKRWQNLKDNSKSYFISEA